MEGGKPGAARIRGCLGGLPLIVIPGVVRWSQVDPHPCVKKMADKWYGYFTVCK